MLWSYEISSVWIYKKNNAILKAGKIIPTIGTRIAGKKDAAIFLFYYLILDNSTKKVLKIININCIWKFFIIKKIYER